MLIMPQDKHVSGSEIAEILSLVDNLPNRRDEPIAGDLDGDFDFWFDGGACRFVTGVTEYVFASGAEASSGVLPFFNLSISFPDGRTVTVKQHIP